MDVLGGYSIELEEKMSKLVGRKGSQVLVNMQKAAISLTLNFARTFRTLLLSRKQLVNLIGTIMIFRDFNPFTPKPA